MNFLKKKILSKEARIGIIGLGYVGLPLLLRFNEVGYSITGFDIDSKKIDLLKKKRTYINHIDIQKLKSNRKKKYFFTNDFSYIGDVDIIILCLPTPLNKKKQPDLSYINNTIKKIMPFLRPYQLISLESTTYPGCTRDLIAKKLNHKFNLGKNFFLSYSPEREDPGNKKNKLKNIPKIISGYSKNCLYLSSLIYNLAFKKIYKVKSLEHAEFTKIYENIFRAVNISLVNEMKYLANKIKVNFNDIVDAASTKPFGFMPFYPGPGIGGHCIPIDPLYLSWLAKKHKIETQLIKYSFVINSNTTKNIIKKISNFILDNKIKDPNILIIGVAYKKNIDDVRESPSLKIMKSFLSKKIKFSYHDPYVSKLPTNRNFNLKISSVPLTKVEIKKFKICLICTDHDNIDYNKIYKYSDIIFDSRNIFDYDDKKIIQV